MRRDWKSPNAQINLADGGMQTLKREGTIAMTVEQILQKTEEADFETWDKKTVKEAVRMKEELAPVLLENLRQYYEQLLDQNWEPDDDAYHRHINGYLLLGELKESRAYPLLLQYLTLSEHQLDNAFGDGFIEELPDVLYHTYDGSLEETKALIRNTQVNEFARGALVKAMGLLCGDGRLPREDLVLFLREVLQGERELENEGFLVCVMELISTIHLWEMCPDLRDLMLCGAVSVPYYEESLNAVFDYKGAKTEKWVPVASGTSGEAVESSEPGGPTAQERAILGYSAGRNDPCPCGSGKKFKKCCGPKQDELKMKYPDYTARHSKQAVKSQTSKLKPITYPPIEGDGNHPGLSDYFPREGIAVDVHAYRGMQTMGQRVIFSSQTSDPVWQIAGEQLWEAFEGFQKICEAQGYHTTAEYDERYAVHYPSTIWLEILADTLRGSRDTRLKAVEKWL